MSRVIAVIPARGGSKRVPQKNKRICAGRPLIEWTIEAARASGCFKDIIVSTDDKDITGIAEQNGVKALKRPANLASDEVTMIPVLQHVAESEGLTDEDCLVLLQPTSPLRNAGHIKEALALFQSHREADGLVSVVKCPKNFHPQKLLTVKDGYARTYFADAPPPGEIKSLPAAYGRNGPSILIVPAGLIRQNRLYGDKVLAYEMDERHSLDIDEEWDFQLADMILKEKS